MCLTKITSKKCELWDTDEYRTGYKVIVDQTDNWQPLYYAHIKKHPFNQWITDKKHYHSSSININCIGFHIFATCDNAETYLLSLCNINANIRIGFNEERQYCTIFKIRYRKVVMRGTQRVLGKDRTEWVNTKCVVAKEIYVEKEN